MHPVGPEFVEAAYGEGEWVDGAFPPVRQTPSGLKHELSLMRTTGWLSPWAAGAKDGFARFGDKHLNKALRHTAAVPADQPKPPHKLAKVLALMKWAVNSWTDADCTAVIRRLVGLSGPKHRPSLLLQGDFLEQCEGGCLARDDYREANKYRTDEQLKVVGVKITGLNWLKENGYISIEEYDNSMEHIMKKKKPKPCGDTHPESHTEAAAAVAMPAPAPGRKLNREAEEWVRENALPKVTGCTTTHTVTVKEKRWKAMYPEAGSRSRNYGEALTTGGRTSQESLHHVLHWAWIQHTAVTGEECQWDFTPRCK